MSVAEIDLTGLEPGPDLPPPPEEAVSAPAPARRSLTGLAPRRAPAVSRLRREARVPEPQESDERDGSDAAGPAPDRERQSGGQAPAGQGPRRPEAHDGRVRPDVGQAPARPVQTGTRPTVDPRTGAVVQGRPVVPGRGYPPSAANARGPVVRRPPPGYRPGQVPVRQRPPGAAPGGAPVGAPPRDRPAGSPMAPAAQAALAQAAAARAAMAASQAPAPPAAVDDTLPRYLQLVRKEARVRADQAEWMAMEVRRINSSRRRRDGVVGERITDNTLIRVALDLLRAQGAALEGTTEDELIRSVLGQDPA